jgi:hypothetical protein
VFQQLFLPQPGFGYPGGCSRSLPQRKVTASPALPDGFFHFLLTQKKVAKKTVACEKMTYASTLAGQKA